MAYDIYPAVDEKYRFPSRVENALKSVIGYDRGVMPADFDVFTINEPGVWFINASNWASIQNLPPIPNAPHKVGVLVADATETIKSFTFTLHGSNPQIWSTTSDTTTTMNPWRRIDERPTTDRGEIPQGANVDDFRGPDWAGSWNISGSATSQAMTGTTPPGTTGWLPGQFLVRGSGGGPTNLSSQIYIPYSSSGEPGMRYFFRTIQRYAQSGSEAWTPWIDLANGTSNGTPSDLPVNSLAIGGRSIRLQMFKDEYPLVSTGGLGAVVFRYDHGLTNFKNVLLPLHQQYDIVPYIAMNSRNWDLDENSGATPAEASTWNVEWGNHTSDHQDKTGIYDVWDTIVNGRIELEDQVGKTVHGFTVPGLPGSNGKLYEKLDGFGVGYASGYSNSYAGSLILNHHAICSGVIGSAYRPLDGEIRIGMRHSGWENKTFTEVKSLIDEAISSKTALTLMQHPRTMGLPGYWTPELADQVIGYVREQIDAGNLANISYYQSHHAQLDPLDVASVGYESGLRDISTELLDGWTGTLFVEREGKNVYFRGTINGKTATSDVPWVLPTGWRPGFIRSGVGQTDYGSGIAWTSETVPKVHRINHYLNRLQITGSNGQTANININHSLRTREAPPTTLPGTPA